jgi:hypothetical protein
VATLAFILASFLDPIQAGIVLAILCLNQGPLPIIVTAAIVAVASDTVMALAAPGYMWGELIAPRLISALMQAAILYWIVQVVRHKLLGRDVMQPHAPNQRASSAGSR